MECYASCPAGFERALADELSSLNLRRIRPLKGRVGFDAEPRDIYRACLWSRLASRVLLVLGRVNAADADELYQGARALPWEEILGEGATIAVTARGTSDTLRNTKFTALRVKDAICDRMVEATGERPDVDTLHADARIAVSIRGDRASLNFDMTGDPLFKRLPREATHENAAHVLRPDYAALLLTQAGWQEACRTEKRADTAGDATEKRAGAASIATDKRADDRGCAAGADAPADEGNAAEKSTPAVGGEGVACPAARPVLVDLACAGSGVAIEAASIALDRAPGLLRRHWGFEGWKPFDRDVWNEVLDDADDRAEAGAECAPLVVATDADPAARTYAERVVRAAGVSGTVRFCEPDPARVVEEARTASAQASRKRGSKDAARAAHEHGAARATADAPCDLHLVADVSATPLTRLAPALALIASTHRISPRAPLALLAANESSARVLGIEPESTLNVRPNNEDAYIYRFGAATDNATDVALSDADGSETSASTFAQAGMGTHGKAGVGGASATPAVPNLLDLGEHGTVPLLVPESEQFAARLKKVARLRRKWAKREGVTCYRVYDADLPDYAVAIDVYNGSPASPGRWLVVAEYQAPKSIDPELARARLLDALAIAPRILEVEPEHVFAKARIRSKGGSQYAQRKRAARPSHATPAEKRPDKPILVEEGGLSFEVNFDDRLDTGIFLDHRVTRDLVRREAARLAEKGLRRFLNLFAYTGTATCYAADGGTNDTTTVDLSNTYLDWADRNLYRNGFTGDEHALIRADVLAWIDAERHGRNRWDLIFCDPPTFSNSSNMKSASFDVQRDHVELLIGVSRLLTREGEAIFSCNLRSFKPDYEKLARAGVVLRDITKETIPEDFARNPRIHHCYILTRTTPEEAMRRLEQQS